MSEILTLINTDLRKFDLTKDEIQAQFSDPDKNWDTIAGYATRIYLIWAYKLCKRWGFQSFDEMIPDICLYACNEAVKYIQFKRYEHGRKLHRPNNPKDRFVCAQAYFQCAKLRMSMILSKYIEENPTSPLNKDKREFTVSELEEDENFLDYLNNDKEEAYGTEDEYDNYEE